MTWTGRRAERRRRTRNAMIFVDRADRLRHFVGTTPGFRLTGTTDGLTAA